MGWFDSLSSGATTALAGVAGDIISSGYKAYQTKKLAGEQAEEYRRAGEANARLYFEDAKTAMTQARELRKQTERNLQIEYEKLDRLIGSQKESYANSGVVVSAGSAAQVQDETARQGKINADIILYNGMTEVNRMKDLAKRYTQAGYNTLNEASYSGYLIESAGATEIGNIAGATLAKTGKSIYDIGTSQGWWSGPTKKDNYPGVGTRGVPTVASNLYTTRH